MGAVLARPDRPNLDRGSHREGHLDQIARLIVPVGLLCLVGACVWQAHLNLYVSPLAVIEPRCLQMLAWLFAIMALAALPLVFLMKKSVARGGLAVH
jgi:hypothetical protein